MVELGYHAADQHQSLRFVESVVLWVFYRSHQHSVKSLAVPFLHLSHNLVQGFDLPLVFLLLGGPEVGEHEQPDGDFEVFGLCAVTAE